MVPVLIVGLSMPGQSTLTCITHGKKYTTLETGMQWPMLLAIASFCIPAIRIGNINISQTMIKACRNTNFKHTVLTKYGVQITCRSLAKRTNEKLPYIIYICDCDIISCAPCVLACDKSPKLTEIRWWIKLGSRWCALRARWAMLIVMTHSGGQCWSLWPTLGGNVNRYDPLWKRMLIVMTYSGGQC